MKIYSRFNEAMMGKQTLADDPSFFAFFLTFHYRLMRNDILDKLMLTRNEYTSRGVDVQTK